MPALNQELSRAINRFNILNAIRRDGPISRVEIAGATGLSNALVTKVTAELMAQNLIIEKASAPSGSRGRRRVHLGLNPEAAHVAGIKIDQDHISFAVVNFQADVLSSLNIPVRTYHGQNDFLANIIDEGVRYCVDEAHLEMPMISGLGIGVPLWTPILQNGAGELLEKVKARLPVPTFVDNDANSVTLAEQWFGLGRGLEHFLVLTLQNGLGLGITVNGQLYRGADGIAAEAGHMVVDPAGPPCICGKRGCLEMFVSGRGILYHARRALEEGRWSFASPATLNMRDVMGLAMHGEQVLVEIFQQAGRMLAMGLGSLIQIFNPQRIILTGENVRAADLMFPVMHETLKQVVSPLFMKPDLIQVQEWDEPNWARGAACLALQEIYKSPFNTLRPLI